MKLHDAFPSNYMKADDLEDGDLTVTIRDHSPVEWAEFQQKGKPTPDNKPVLYFQHPREAKALVLNKTNWKTIADVLGTDETDDWGGKQITLYATEVESFGETVLAVRVRMKKGKSNSNGQKPTQNTNNPTFDAIKAKIEQWSDQVQIAAEVKRQLSAFDAARISDLTPAQLQEFKTGLELWMEKHKPPVEQVTSDDVPF
jgi:hypothetical protein